MDNSKVLFCTSLSPNFGHMIRRTFLLAHKYHAPVEIHHIAHPDERNSDNELIALIEWAIKQNREAFHKHHPYDIVIERGEFNSLFGERVRKNDHVFLIAGYPKDHPHSLSHHFDLDKFAKDTILFRYEMVSNAVKEFNYRMEMQLRDLGVIRRLLKISFYMEINFTCHYIIDAQGENKRLIRDIEGLLNEKLKKGKGSIEFEGHTPENYKGKTTIMNEMLVVSKNQVVSFTNEYKLNQIAVMIMSV